LIFQNFPQRGGKSIKANTNNPPQDPPPPNNIVEAPEAAMPEITNVTPIEIPQIDIVKTPEIIQPIKIKKQTSTIKETPKPIKAVTKVTKQVPKITLRQKIISFIKKLFRRN